ncbi:MAG: hypothetical protein JRD89_02810, partial [Deltaproteobacteria bacterium]|nr:hypothetical protein [Deltaproteobacteria bacterium]
MSGEMQQIEITDAVHADVVNAKIVIPGNRTHAKAMTEAERDALTGDDLFVGRTIFNTTAGRFEVYDGANWTTVNLSDATIDTDIDWAGHLIKNLGDPVAPDDVAKKLYVDLATTGLGVDYYLLDAADSGVPAYKQLTAAPPDLGEAYIEVTQNTAGDYEVGSWIAPANGVDRIGLGVYTINLQSEIVSGLESADIRFFFRLYERESGGTENLIVESTPSNIIGDTRENVVTSAILASDYVMAAGSRLVLKLYASWGDSKSATVRVYYQGNVKSRLAVPTEKEILDTLYAAITHASRHELGGPDEVSIDASQVGSGVLTVDRIPDLTRGKITDLFSSPFWDNIPDKPSVFPPETHTHDHGSLTGLDDD